MKEMVRYGFILGIICIAAGGVLAGVNSVTKSRIIAQAKLEEEATLIELLPQAKSFEPVESEAGDIIYYKASDKEGNPVGIVFKAKGKGYSSVIDTMAGMNKEGAIIGIKVISQNETPGLGSRVTGKSFLEQFINKNAFSLNDVQAITGATISSTAVIESVKKKAEEIKELINNVPKQ